MRIEPLTAHDPSVVGPWQLVGRIGAGGMGQVYLGRRSTRSRTQEVAVKVIPEYLLGRDTALARFRREIAVLISLDDPGVARVVAADLDEEPPWYAADLIDGPTLAHHVQTEGPLAPDLWASAALTLAMTLTRLHARGIIHRDLKPHNVVLGPHGPVIIDFGISAVMGSTSLTSTGDSPRTELWAAPEQLRNQESTTATDVFATGTLLAWAATGVHPFAPHGEYHREGLIAAILTAEPALDALPPETQAWLAPMLEKAPGDRPSALDVVESMTEVSVDTAVRLAEAAAASGWATAARGWWQVAADAGDPEAYFQLGNLAAGDADVAAARSWWRLAAEAGHAEAARRADEPLAPVPAAGALPPASSGDPRHTVGSTPLPGTAIASSGPIVDSSSATALIPQVAEPPGPLRRRHGARRRVLWGLLACAVLVAALAIWRPNILGNDQAQSGDGGVAMSTRPLPVALDGSGLERQVYRLAVGDSSACAITRDRRARCWGSNSDGQLGSTGGDADAPRAVSTTGTLRGIQLDRIAVGSAHACALDVAGRVFCWGSNASGQLGVDSTHVTSSTEPVRPNPKGVLAGKTLTRIGAAGETSCALDVAGALYCWGQGETGQLGNGSSTSSSDPVRVDTSGELNGHALRQFGVGGDHSCAVDERAAIYCWGANSHGQLGDGTQAVTLTPHRVIPPRSGPEPAYDAVNLGFQATCARTTAGQALCWGSNEHGQLGSGPGDGTDQPQRVASPNGSWPVQRVAISGPTACSVSDENRVFCWGDNASGQLGNGTTDPASVPVPVTNPPGGSLPQLSLVALGPTTTCGVDVDFGAWCWGSNEHGMLGTGAG